MRIDRRNKILVCTMLSTPQDEELATSVREHNVPLLHISHNSINLEAPSSTTKDFAQDKTSQKLTLSKKQEMSIARLKLEMGLPIEAERKKKKKKKGVNPLACKKKKTVMNGVVNGGVDKASKKSRRKRKKVKIPSHVKDALLKS